MLPRDLLTLFSAEKNFLGSAPISTNTPPALTAPALIRVSANLSQKGVSDHQALLAVVLPFWRMD